MQTLKPSEIASYCNVHQRSVSRWIANGELKGHKLPGRGNYRVLLEDFLSFLNKHKIPLSQDFISDYQIAESGLHSDKERDLAKVLIIDDEPQYRKAIRRVIGNDYLIQEAGDGFMAGIAISEFKPSLITLNLSMPGMDGFQVISFIREKEEFKAIKILVISALNDVELEKAKTMGANDALSKPFDNSILLEKINALIQG